MAKCPDKRGCRPLAVLPLADGFMCVGDLKRPTDHILPKVNDLQLCFRQGRACNRWHLNENDILAFFDLLVRALEARSKEIDDALHTP